MALAHTIENPAEAAYRRGELMQKRAAMMAAWANFLTAQPRAGKVVPLGKRARA
jgi:hypothetical protein